MEHALNEIMIEISDSENRLKFDFDFHHLGFTHLW